MTTQQPDSPTTTPARARYPRPIAIPTPLDVHQGRGLAASHSRAPRAGRRVRCPPPRRTRRRRGCRRGARPRSASASWCATPSPLSLGAQPRPRDSRARPPAPRTHHRPSTCSGRRVGPRRSRPRPPAAVLAATSRASPPPRASSELGAGTGWMAAPRERVHERGAVWVATETSASGAVDRLDANLASQSRSTAAALERPRRPTRTPRRPPRAAALDWDDVERSPLSREPWDLIVDPTSPPPPRARRRSRDAAAARRRRPTR